MVCIPPTAACLRRRYRPRRSTGRCVDRTRSGSKSGSPSCRLRSANAPFIASDTRRMYFADRLIADIVDLVLQEVAPAVRVRPQDRVLPHVGLHQRTGDGRRVEDRRGRPLSRAVTGHHQVPAHSARVRVDHPLHDGRRQCGVECVTASRQHLRTFLDSQWLRSHYHSWHGHISHKHDGAIDRQPHRLAQQCAFSEQPIAIQRHHQMGGRGSHRASLFCDAALPQFCDADLPQRGKTR